MKIDIFDIDEFVKVNHCQEITNPVFYDWSGQPTPDGLFQYDIFGMTDAQRKNTFGYIDLGGHYIHPIVYTMIKTRMQAIKDVLLGNKSAIIVNKKIQPISNEDAIKYPDAGSGIEFLYENYEKIDWINEVDEEDIDQIDKKARLKFLKQIKKNEFFVSKWLVLPPYYRAENPEDKQMGDIINSIYKDILQKTKQMKSGFSFQLFGDNTKMAIQQLLMNCYLQTLSPLSGKNLQIDGTIKGSSKNQLVRKHLMGKTVDFTAQNVITAPEISAAKTVDDLPAPFGYSAFPLATLLSLFNPFFVNYFQSFLEKGIYNIAFTLQNKYDIDIGQYNTEECKKLIKKFIKSEDERNMPITIKCRDKETHEEMIQTLRMVEYPSEEDAYSRKNEFIHDLTLADLAYIAANEVLISQNMHVYVTRYPVTNFQNIYPCRIKIKTTPKVKDVWVRLYNRKDIEANSSGSYRFQHFKDYPIIQYEQGPKLSPADTRFYSVMICGNEYLKAMGGDYDGDMLYFKPVFTKEANAEADKLIFSKSNILGATGAPTRGIQKIGKDATITLYEFTKEG